MVQVPAAAGGGQGTVGREEVQYGANRLTNVGRNWLLEKCVKEHVFPGENESAGRGCGRLVGEFKENGT